MASSIPRNDDGYPWLSWVRTGILTLAGVLVFGLAESALYPPQAPPVENGGEAAKAKAAAGASTATPPADSSAPALGSSAGPSPASPPKPDPIVAKESPAPQPVPQSPAAEPAPAPQPVPQPKPAPPKPPAAQDPAKRDAFVRAVADVRAAMSARNLEASKRSLAAAAAQVQGETDQAELDRLTALEDHLEQFWELMRKAVAGMQPAEEIEISESNRVAVVEASREILAVRREGQSQRYRIEALPADLLAGIIKSSFQTTPGTKLIVGSFLAMDAQGNRLRARNLWLEAIRDGESQGTMLLSELDVPRAGQGK